MTVDKYGVWACTPIGYRMETDEQDNKTPHVHLFFTQHKKAKSGEFFGAAINVKSITEESRLIVWHLPDFRFRAITDDLQRLQQGFHRIRSNTSSSPKGLDYTRIDGLIPNFPAGGILLHHDIPGDNNDMLDKMGPILHRAIQKRATVYVFGSQYGSSDGIHNVHMNQGSLPKFSNGVNQDGAIIIQFEHHWEAVFLAFGSQRVPTDDVKGLSEPGSISLAEQLGEVPTASERSRTPERN